MTFVGTIPWVEPEGLYNVDGHRRDGFVSESADFIEHQFDSRLAYSPGFDIPVPNIPRGKKCVLPLPCTFTNLIYEFDEQ